MSCEWLTVREACAWFKIDNTTLYRYMRQGKVHFIRLGKNIRICPTVPGDVPRAPGSVGPQVRAMMEHQD